MLLAEIFIALSIISPIRAQTSNSAPGCFPTITIKKIEISKKIPLTGDEPYFGLKTFTSPPNFVGHCLLTVPRYNTKEIAPGSYDPIVEWGRPAVEFGATPNSNKKGPDTAFASVKIKIPEPDGFATISCFSQKGPVLPEQFSDTFEGLIQFEFGNN